MGCTNLSACCCCRTSDRPLLAPWAKCPLPLSSCSSDDPPTHITCIHLMQQLSRLCTAWPCGRSCSPHLCQHNSLTGKALAAAAVCSLYMTDYYGSPVKHGLKHGSLLHSTSTCLINCKPAVESCQYVWLYASPQHLTRGSYNSNVFCAFCVSVQT